MVATSFTANHQWGPPRTDGSVIGALDGNWTMDVQFITALPTNINAWTVLGANATTVPNPVIAVGLRVRLDRFSDITIDIKAGSDPNCFNINGHGVVPVAILTTSVADGDAFDFDATQVNIMSLMLDGQAVSVRGKNKIMCHFEDVDGDGDTDLVCQIEDEDNTYEVGDGTGTLTGNLNDGTPIQGSDFICITQ